MAGTFSENRLRQLDELDVLESAYSEEEISVTTPLLVQRLRAWRDSEKELLPQKSAEKEEGLVGLALLLPVTLFDGSLDFVLRASVELPLEYPSTSIPDVRVLGVTDAGSEGRSSRSVICDRASFNQAIVENMRLAEGQEQLFTAIGFMTDNCTEYCRYSQGVKARRTTGPNDPTPAAAAAVHRHFLSFGHLLHGPGHDKEKAMVKAARTLGLKGAILYGTPGIIVIESIDEDDLVAYDKECRSIGKRATLVLAETVDNAAFTDRPNGLKGLEDLQTLQTLMCERMGHAETEYRSVLGLR